LVAVAIERPHDASPIPHVAADLYFSGPRRPRLLVGEPITLNLVVGLLAVFSGIWISTTEAKPALP
jgi:hypothetical protein